VGSDDFWAQAKADMASARRRLLVQAMTFEADAAGGAVGQAVLASSAEDRRVLVDDYTRFVISDRFVYSPHNLLDPGFRAEVKATRGMFGSMARSGVGVRVTNPSGPFLAGFAYRNHKKLIVADNAAYLGGINFSDHNFAWHDLMLRIEDAQVSDLLAADFDATYTGQGRSWTNRQDAVVLYGLDGRDNHARYAEIIALIDGAKTQINVISPYLTFPFCDALARARQRGVKVTLVTPDANNKPTVRDYLVWAAARAGFEVLLTREMIHLKGMLIDDERLVLGSSNFDFVSYWIEEELVAVISDAGLIEDFRRRVLAPLASDARPATDADISETKGRRAERLLRTAGRILSLGCPIRRTSVAWSG
jgi:cardiolipin synthase